MDYQFTTLEISEPAKHVLLVILNRPEVRNAISSHMMKDLRNLWQELYVDPASIRCVILTGKGEKAFCAGADLKERNNLDPAIWNKQHHMLEQAMVAMVNCPVPIIAAVNGAAFGGGLELVLGSDFAYAANNASFGFPETKLGIIPGAMGTQNLPRACGIRRAKEICFTGESFSAEQALEWGIINKICTPEELLAQSLAVAQKISENAPLAVSQVKKSLRASDQSLETGYRYEIEAYTPLISTKDRVEGIRAFNEKRTAIFEGC